MAEPEGGISRRSDASDRSDALRDRRGEMRRMLERVRAAIGASEAHAERTRLLIARSEALAWSSTHVTREAALVRLRLREAVTAYVRYLYEEGVPPQRMLVLVKSRVRDGTPPELDVADSRALMADVVRWSIDAYYAA